MEESQDFKDVAAVVKSNSASNPVSQDSRKPFDIRDYLPQALFFTTLTLLRVLPLRYLMLSTFIYFSLRGLLCLRYPTVGHPNVIDDLRISGGATLGLFAGPTALFLQIDNVSISLAVRSHSDFYLKPLTRTIRTILFLELALGGTSMEKEQTASWLRYLHRTVDGSIAPQSRKELGLPTDYVGYGYTNELKAYVLEMLTYSTISFLERFDKNLSHRTKDLVTLEFTCVGLRLGIPLDYLARDYDSFLTSFHRHIDRHPAKVTQEMITSIETAILDTEMKWVTSVLLRASLMIGHDLLPEKVKQRYEFRVLDSPMKKLSQGTLCATLWFIYPFLPSLSMRGLLSLFLIFEPGLRSKFKSSLDAVHSMDIITDKPTYSNQCFNDPFLSIYANNTPRLSYISWLSLPSRRDARPSTLQLLLVRTLEAQTSTLWSAWLIYPWILLMTVLESWWFLFMTSLRTLHSQIVESKLFYPKNHLSSGPSLPNHVGIIMDGNRRFARQLDQPVVYGHAKGAVTGSNVLEWWLRYVPHSTAGRPKYLTCWAFSSENFSRPKEETQALFQLMESEFKSLAFTSIIHLFRIRVCVIGGDAELARLPTELRKTIKLLEDVTHGYDDLMLMLAVGYGGRREIVDSVQGLVSRGEEVNERSIGSKTYCARLGVPPVDMILRTSERRTSGFFLWDTQGAELHFVNKLWPQLTEVDWLNSLGNFSQREIRGGK